MSTVGGAISGYCATGSSCAASSPASTMTMAMTPAKTGRWMKKRDTLSRLLHLHRGARAQAGEVVEDHHVARLQALEHHPVPAEPRAGADVARQRFAVAARDP